MNRVRSLLELENVAERCKVPGTNEFHVRENASRNLRALSRLSGARLLIGKGQVHRRGATKHGEDSY